ncbi:Serine/threonine protein kinase [Gracilaria domingensis]|nr:Serine/threonine protein kinase [Gracilaria domingensis]
MGNGISSARNSTPSDTPFSRPRRGAKRSRRKRDRALAQRAPLDQAPHRAAVPNADRIDFDPRNLPQRDAPRMHPEGAHRFRRAANGYHSRPLSPHQQQHSPVGAVPLRSSPQSNINARSPHDANRRYPAAAAPVQHPYVSDNRPAPSSHAPVKYGRPDTLGLQRKDFINVHRKDYTGRIELFQGSVEGLSKADETDLLIVYLRERGQYKANRDSSLAALNRSGISLASLERESKIEPSYRRHYHCWLSRPLPRPRPLGFEYKRLLVYEDPGEELTRDDSIILDIVKCLTTVIGGDVQIQSVLIPLSGALLSPSLRKHFVQAAVEVAYAWMHMGLPLRTVKILLPDTDITKDIEMFRRTKESLTGSSAVPLLMPPRNYDVFFSFAPADKDSATDMIAYLTSKNPQIRIHGWRNLAIYLSENAALLITRSWMRSGRVIRSLRCCLMTTFIQWNVLRPFPWRSVATLRVWAISSFPYIGKDAISHLLLEGLLRQRALIVASTTFPELPYC